MRHHFISRHIQIHRTWMKFFVCQAWLSTCPSLLLRIVSVHQLWNSYSPQSRNQTCDQTSAKANSRRVISSLPQPWQLPPQVTTFSPLW